MGLSKRKKKTVDIETCKVSMFWKKVVNYEKTYEEINYNENVQGKL